MLVTLTMAQQGRNLPMSYYQEHLDAVREILTPRPQGTPYKPKSPYCYVTGWEAAKEGRPNTPSEDANLLWHMQGMSKERMTDTMAGFSDGFAAYHRYTGLK